MSTFSQWWTSFQKNPKPRQISWVCGSEPVLVDEVVSLIRESVPVDPINLVYIDARDTSERDVWNGLRQLPFGIKATRLNIVLGAEKLKNGAAFTQYIKDRGALPRNYVIFVSDEPTLRKISEEKRDLWEPLEFLKGKGSLVECRAFTSATAKYAVEWVKQKAEIRGRVAEHLLNRANGDLRIVRDTVRKLLVFPGEITLRIVSEMFEEQPADTFLGALFALDRKTAYSALEELPKSEYLRTLGLVDARLDLAGLVHDMLVSHKTSGEIARAAGSKGFLVPDMLPVAKHYNKNRRVRIRNYLALLDGYSYYGVPEGALEGLVAVW